MRAAPATVSGFVSHPGGTFEAWAQPTKDGGPPRRQHEMTQQSASARALVIISTIVAALVLLLATAVHAFGGSDPVATDIYRVQGGDTLWSIASDVAEPGSDLRAVVADIRRLNDLPGPVIHAGDLLAVPADS